MFHKKEIVGQKKRVIVVDDDESIVRSVALILEKNGFDVDTAQTGKEALAKFKVHRYDVILMDLKLPDMDGIEILSKANSPDSVKIMLTGYHSIVSAIEAAELGVSVYLRKPVKPEELIYVVRSKLQERK